MSFYGTVSGADTYFSDRGVDTWAGADELKEEALLRGSIYIDSTYRGRFPGWPTEQRDQVREWPRADAYDIYGNSIPSTETPREVEQATYEAALRELVEPGSLNPDFDPSAQNKHEKVDVIEVEKMAPYGPQSVKPVVNIIAGIIAPVLTGGVGSGIAGQSARI